MFCHKCGKKNDPESKHCIECGVNLEQSSDLVVKKKIKKDIIKSLLKKMVLFISIFILSLVIVKSLTASYDYEYGTLPALAISIIIVFVWGRLAKRFSL